MNNFTPTEKLMQGIARLEQVRTIAGTTAPIAAAPAGEALSEIEHLSIEALLILNSLRGQLGGAS